MNRMKHDKGTSARSEWNRKKLSDIDDQQPYRSYSEPGIRERERRIERKRVFMCS